MLETANTLEDARERRALLHFIVVGANFDALPNIAKSYGVGNVALAGYNAVAQMDRFQLGQFDELKDAFVSHGALHECQSVEVF